MFTVHHKGSTKNIQDLRNFAHFAHFAQKTPTRKYKKKPALDGERVYFKTCAQQESNYLIKTINLLTNPLDLGPDGKR